MPAPVSWPGTPTSLWASFPGGVGAPNVPIPLSGGASRSRRHSKSRRHKKSRKSMRRRRQTRRR